ncbi:MAG TPA: hypothetical protein VGK74_04840 [Symbiobacteriaceae bacterium]|jgi:hypothetical protein
MNPLVRETAIITFYTFWYSALIGAATALLLKWPLTATYMLAILTIGPSLAILRGRNREKDKLDIGERAAAEILSLIILMAIGGLAGRYLGR